MAKRCEVWVRSFCQCSGLCACMAALCCAVAASIFIYVAGDGAGNGPAPAAVAYKCTSDLYFGRVLKPEQKGLAIDDTTFHECGHAIPRMWPNTQAPLTSLRLFKAWDKAWPDGGRVEAWSQLEVVVREGQMQVLVGTQVTCDEQDDDRDWRLVKQLVQVLGRQHVMGIAVGNELELLQFKENVSTECIQRMWKGGYFLRKLSERAADLDHLASCGQHGQPPVDRGNWLVFTAGCYTNRSNDILPSIFINATPRSASFSQIAPRNCLYRWKVVHKNS
ncbi:unnamed protein product [Durusdinium trenchii]|uniref:Uncharacterized protein n=1 Tax=Durusdinium trenchii TaxID=1381693 RepID=A0ABP0IJF2_9DINO